MSLDGLVPLGWDDGFARELGDDGIPARVVAEHRGAYDVLTGEVRLNDVRVTAPFRRAAESPADFPAVGDWVVLDAVPAESSADPPVIERVLERRSDLVRRAAGLEPAPQVLVANVDEALVVTDAVDDLNARRIERYLTMAYGGDVDVAVVIAKVDVAGDLVQPALDLLASIAPEVAVVPVSSLTGAGVEDVAARLRPGRTTALLGSSGVGKSSLVNRLLGDAVQDTGAVREHDGRGRHTTIRRELFPLPSGALLVDTPGIREVQLWDASGLDAAFPEIADVAPDCRFADCRHEGEPGCAVRVAVDAGRIDPDRLASYQALWAEADAVDDEREVRRRGGR